MMYRLLPALLAVSSVSALTISPSCQNAFTGVANNADANACLSVSSLLSAVINPNASIVTQVGNMVNTLCAAPTCSNATLAAVVSNITSGCSTELSEAGAGSDSTTSAITSAVQQYYGLVRSIVCLKDNNDSGTNCLVQTLTNVQTTYGSLSINSIDTTLAAIEKTTSLPTNITCTDCIKEAYNLVNASFPSISPTLSSELSVCGANFTDGTDPSNIVQTATTKSTGGNAALVLQSGNALVALFGSFLLAALA